MSKAGIPTSNADWDSVTVIRKKPVSTSTLKSDAELNAARRAGMSLETEKKSSQLNAGKAVDGQKLAKIDRETEDFHVEKVSLSLSKAIQQARMAKEMTQKVN
jgi:putative transcription factor